MPLRFLALFLWHQSAMALVIAANFVTGGWPATAEVGAIWWL